MFSELVSFFRIQQNFLGVADISGSQTVSELPFREPSPNASTESVSVTLRLAVSELVRPGVEHLLGLMSILRSMGRLSPQYFPGAPSLTGGWVWSLSWVRVFIPVNKMCTTYTWLYIYIYI